MTEDEVRAIAEECFPKKPLLLPIEAAAGFRKTIRTIRNWYEEGILEGTKPKGALLIYRVSAIKVFLENHGRKGGDDIEENDREGKIRSSAGKSLRHARRSNWVKNW